MYKNQITEREILKPTKALSVRVFIPVLDKFDCAFAVLGDFLCGFSVSNRPLVTLPSCTYGNMHS